MKCKSISWVVVIVYRNVCRATIVHLQVIKFNVCHFNLDCDNSFLNYFDGDLDDDNYRYCGLKNLVIPRSTSNMAVFQLIPNYYNADDVVIRYTSELVEWADSGKSGTKWFLCYMRKDIWKQKVLIHGRTMPPYNHTGNKLSHTHAHKNINTHGSTGKDKQTIRPTHTTVCF